MKAVVSQLYRESLKTKNLSLQLALLYCTEIINSSQGELYARMAEHGAVGIGVGVAKYLLGEVFWNDVKSQFYAACPAIPTLQAIYSGEKHLVNMAFSVDDLRQQYLKMKATVEIERLMDKTYISLRQSYVSNRTVEAVRAFISAHDVLFKLRDEDCKQAYKFSDVVNDAVVNQVKQWFGASDNSSLKSSIRSLQINYAEIHRSAMVYWVFALKEDYSDSGLFEQYSNLAEESRETLLTREFLAACPVDVYVYDGSNQLVASVVDGRIFNNADIMVALLGDTKIIRFYDKQNYRIEYAGTDYSKMDVTISEFDENKDVSRTVNYYSHPT